MRQFELQTMEPTSHLTSRLAITATSRRRRRLAWRNLVQFYVLSLVCIILRCINALAAKGSHNSKRVVVVEPFGMGDLIALEPLTTTLHENGWRVTVMGQERWRPVLSEVDWISVPKSWHEMTISELVGFARKLLRTSRPEYRGSVGIDPRGNISSITLLLLLGCKEVFTLDHYEGTTTRIPYGVAHRAVHETASVMRWELALQFLHAFHIPNPQNRPPQAEHLRGTVSVDSKQVGLISVAPWAGKRWIAERWAMVIQYLRENGYQPVTICGPGQKAEALAAIGTEDVPVLEAASVPSLAQTIAGCAAVLTIDSGPMHLAGALNVPVVALFGTGQLPMWAPFSRHARIVTSPGFWEQNGDSVNVHPVGKNAALGQQGMSQISSDSVIQAFQELWEQVNSPNDRKPI